VRAFLSALSKDPMRNSLSRLLPHVRGLEEEKGEVQSAHICLREPSLDVSLNSTAIVQIRIATIFSSEQDINKHVVDLSHVDGPSITFKR
jgi:hypothetical protein